MRSVNLARFTETRLPVSQYCDSFICLLNFTAAHGNSVKFQLIQLTLPNIDHSMDCLYEGVAIYDGRKHDLYTLDYYSKHSTRAPDQLTPIVRICGKVRQTVGAETRDDYLVNTVVSTGNSLIVVFYSFHQILSKGQLHFTTDVSHCQGFYAFCGQITQPIKAASTCNPATNCYEIFDELKLARYYKDIAAFFSDRLEIPIIERDAYMELQTVNTTKGTHTYNVVAVRPIDCAVIQYFPRKFYPTGRARECTISMIRARDTGSGELNVTVDHLTEYSKQCTPLQPSVWIHSHWALLLGADESQAYILSDLVPQCSQISAFVAQPTTSFTDMLHTRQTKVTGQYIENTFLGIQQKLHKYSHSLNHNLLINASKPLSYSEEQFGIGHVRSLLNTDSPLFYTPISHKQLETMIAFWTQSCVVHLTINLVYEYSIAIRSSKLYNIQFTTKLQPETNVTFRQPYFYFRRYIILKIHKVTSHESAICNIGFIIDTNKQFGVPKGLEELRLVETTTSLPVHLSLHDHVYVAWGYKSLSWHEANARCSAMGGYLPSVTTMDEIDFLEKAVWGKFTPHQLYIHPCRSWSVVCSFFMGLNNRLVSSKLWKVVSLL